jgi:glutamine synthetase
MSEIRIKNFKEIPYEQLEELNLEAKRRMLAREEPGTLEEHYLRYLADERALKAVTVGFSDLEGRFHMLDYDKKFLLRSHRNLTFDGSSIRGFSRQAESDLRLRPDWASFRWLPSDVFGPGKVLVFGQVYGLDDRPYPADMRNRLREVNESLLRERGITTNLAVEIEGFLFSGVDAEQRYTSREGFQFVSEGGYFNSLPMAPLKIFIDRFAEAQRALGFENEKDHPEVAPAQFELNYAHTDALVACDQIQLYKLLARQIAAHMGCTASFLPKPRTGVNGSGMHVNLSLSRDGRNLFFDPAGPDRLSDLAWGVVDRLLTSALDLCLVFNASVNAYRRLDPRFEAPNEIRASGVDRSAMIRIPAGSEKSARIELRSVGPDANPYLTALSLLRTGLDGPCCIRNAADRASRERKLPDNIQRAIDLFRQSPWVADMLGAEHQRRYADLKQAAADRCPRNLGQIIKTGEILFHHEVTNQHLWNAF